MYIFKLYISEHLLIFTVQSKFVILKAQLSVSLSNQGNTNYKHLTSVGTSFFFLVLNWLTKSKSIKKIKAHRLHLRLRKKSWFQVNVFSQHFEIKNVPCYIVKIQQKYQMKTKCYKMLKGTVFHKAHKL